MQSDLSWRRAVSMVGVVLWTLVGLVVSFGFVMTLSWGWSNFVQNPLWLQVLTWGVVLAPVLGLVAAFVAEKTVRKHGLTVMTTALVIQLFSLFTPMLVT